MNVLSLFDGISCGQVALERVGIKVNKYYASEIDKYASQITKKNYPNTVQLGDVTRWQEWDIDWASIDLLIGGSPCFTAGTLVMTSNGLKEIEDIQVGDYVLTHKSRYRKVLRIGNKQVNKVYKIKAMGLPELETTEEHPFYIREKYVKNSKEFGHQRLFKSPEWRKACELNKNTYLGCTYNTENTNKEIFRANDTNFWYFVGRFTADGWIIKTKRKQRESSYVYKVILCCGRHEFDECKNILDNIGYHYNFVEEKNCFKFCITNKSLLDYLEQIKMGALNKIIHPDVWSLPLASKKAFVDGYISGDGCIKDDKFIKATSISKKLVYGLKLLVNEVYNRPCTLHHDRRKPNHVIEGRTVNQHDTYVVGFKLIDSKQDECLFENNYNWYPIRKIQTEDRVCTVYNLEVEEDNSYTANTVVVHNCQGFSFAGKQLNFDDPRSKLFFEYANILNHIKKHNPNVKFLLENVKMKKEYQGVISSYLGAEPVEINSALVSAQNRKRLYWTNIGKIEQPEDKGILLKDIVHENTIPEVGPCASNNKKHVSTTSYEGATVWDSYEREQRTGLFEYLKEYIVPFDKTLQILDKEVQSGKVGYFRKDSQANRVYYIHNKAVTLCGDAGGGAAKMGQYLFGCITPNSFVPTNKINNPEFKKSYLQYDVNGLGHGSQDQRAYYLNDKHSCLDTGCSSKAKVLFGCLTSDRIEERQNEQYFNDDKKFYTSSSRGKHGVLIEGYIRKLTPIECERLQTLPDDYTKHGVDDFGNLIVISNSQRYKCLGNGWTVDVIAHILKGIKE